MFQFGGLEHCLGVLAHQNPPVATGLKPTLEELDRLTGIKRLTSSFLKTFST